MLVLDDWPYHAQYKVILYCSFPTKGWSKFYISHQFRPGHGSERVTGTVNCSGNKVCTGEIDYFPVVPAQVTVRSPCVMREVTHDFDRFIGAEHTWWTLSHKSTAYIVLTMGMQIPTVFWTRTHTVRVRVWPSQTCNVWLPSDKCPECSVVSQRTKSGVLN